MSPTPVKNLVTLNIIFLSCSTTTVAVIQVTLEKLISSHVLHRRTDRQTKSCQTVSSRHSSDVCTALMRHDESATKIHLGLGGKKLWKERRELWERKGQGEILVIIKLHGWNGNSANHTSHLCTSKLFHRHNKIYHVITTHV